MNMRKLFAAILLMATSSIFAETWTQTLKGYDCRGSCWLYADTSNVLYGKHLITSDDAWFWNTSSLFFNDSQIVFGNKSYDYGEPDVLPGQIIFSYKPTMSGCRIPESYYEHQCEYGLSVVFKDTSESSIVTINVSAVISSSFEGAGILFATFCIALITPALLFSA